ncbi:AIR synthase-related protein [Algoriphagus halophilus]|uniref:AIR synthase-related protein n=1 Tax=Algoriphagus halophilus TaxID=226505 RepID=UPI0035900F58
MKEARLAHQTLTPHQELHAMHDVTEGGILGAIQEMANASGLGFSVNAADIPVPTEVQQVSELFGIDPLISIGAGSMIMAVTPESENKLINRLKDEGIPAVSIGTFTNSPMNTLLGKSGGSSNFEFNGIDPYWGAFFKALQQGMT